jgi:hypothetical protein
VARVIVERDFNEPQSFDELQDRELRHAWCLEMHGVRFIQTYLSDDRRRMICEYEAPDVESVRIAQTKAGMPFSRAWAAEIL